jgi:hypothetical protein
MKAIVLLVAALVLALALPCSAMGPLMIDAHRVACDRNTEADMSGYYVYWRVVGATAWDNAHRSPLIPQVPVGQLGCPYDLMLFNLPNGNYEISATAIDVPGNESGPSNVVPFQVDLPASPSTLRKQ